MGSHSSSTNICILLVAPEISSIQKTLAVLLDADYRVAVAYNAEDAIAQIKEKKHEVHLVLTETNLPDMCIFKFVQILDAVYRVAVVVLMERYHVPTMLGCLSNGAMYCFAKPLRPHNAKILWQHALYKEGENMREFSGSDDIHEESEMVEAEEVEAEEIPAVPVPPFDAVLLRHVNASGLSMGNNTETLQAPPQPPPASVVYRLFPPGYTTLTQVPPLTLATALARPLVEDPRDNGNQAQHLPTLSPSLDPTAFPSSSMRQEDGEGTSSSPGEIREEMLVKGSD